MKAPGRTLRPWEEGWKENIFRKSGHSKASTYIDVFRTPGHAHDKDKLGESSKRIPSFSFCWLLSSVWWNFSSLSPILFIPASHLWLSSLLHFVYLLYSLSLPSLIHLIPHLLRYLELSQPSYFCQKLKKQRLWRKKSTSFTETA